MKPWLDRLRKRIQEGNRTAFNAGMEWIAQNKSKPTMPTKYERTLREAPSGPVDWTVWRCPECGTEQAGEECSYCRRESVVAERHQEPRGNVDAA